MRHMFMIKSLSLSALLINFNDHKFGFFAATMTELYLSLSNQKNFHLEVVCASKGQQKSFYQQNLTILVLRVHIKHEARVE